MSNPRRPFRLNVGFIVHEEVGYNHTFPFAFDNLQFEDDLTLRAFEGQAMIGRTPQGLIVQAHFEATTSLECVRCLEAFDLQLHLDMTEMYAFSRKSVAESGLLLPEDAHIDLQPLVREYALLELPIKPLCKPDCKGLCPICGENLNQINCGHYALSGESPFSGLKDLLEE
ncbi:MAG: DUF177 domain-containing protein [Anaerolineales bacterium]